MTTKYYPGEPKEFTLRTIVEAVNAAADAGGDSRPIVAHFGDSFQHQGNYGWRAPWSASAVGSVAGIAFVGLERKAASGAHTLAYTAATKSCSFDGGPATVLVDGFQIIPGPTALTGCGITVRVEGLAATDGTITFTRQGTRPDEIVDSKSIAFWVTALSSLGYSTRVYAHGGGQIRDGLSIVERATSYSIFTINYGTNDIAAGRTLAQLKTDILALVEATYEKATTNKGVVLGICPFRSGFTTAQSEIADQFNRWLPSALRAFPGVVAQFPWQRMIDATGTAGNTLMINVDNVHPSDPNAQYAGKGIVDYLTAVTPGTAWDFGAALGRWSATNPGGNLILNPNPVGNNAGQPSNWGTLAKGDPSATPTKVARTDGIAGEWARITSNATADNISNTYTIPTTQFPNPPANGTVVQAFVEVRLSGAFQMVPLLLLTELRDGAVVAWSRVNSSSDNKSLQMTEWVGIIATPPYVWSDTAGVPTMDIRIGQRLNNGASGAILDIGRVWVGTPNEVTIF
jgi:hypothetical protein